MKVLSKPLNLLKMDKLEIFDKYGNRLSVADVIYSYIKLEADKANKDIEDVYLGAYSPKNPWLELYQATDNGYDGTDLNSFGEPIKVNNVY